MTYDEQDQMDSQIEVHNSPGRRDCRSPGLVFVCRL